MYDAESDQLSVQQGSTDGALELKNCPYCRRPLQDDYLGGDDAECRSRFRGFENDRPSVNPGYFGMLAASQWHVSEPLARSSTIGEYVPPALRSGRSRDVSGAGEPPPDAEFVGSEAVPSAREGISQSAFSPGYFKQFFRQIRELGRGGNGVVLLVEHMMDRVSLGQFACKRVPVGDDHQWLEKVLVEVKLLQAIPHQNLVAYHWVWLEDHKSSPFSPSIPCLWILQEYCNGGDLHEYVIGPRQGDLDAAEMKDKLRRRSKGDPELPRDLTGPNKLGFDDIFSFFRDITAGLHHLHTKGYLHRDLKPSNCLLQWDGHRARVLISDFGEAQAASAKRRSSGYTGTFSYCAPEVLTGSADGTFGEFTTKSDIFSLGMIVYFMCFSRLPYTTTDGISEENEDLDELRAEITTWSGFDDQTRMRSDLPERLYKYLSRLLSVDQRDRPSTNEILRSIKGGIGLEDLSSSATEEGSSQVPSMDSSRHFPSPPGRNRKASRAGVPSLGRNASTDTVHPVGPSGRQSRASSGPTSPIDSCVVKSPRGAEFVDSTAERGHPRLMLPAPPTTRPLVSWPGQFTRFAFLRAAVFLGKLLSVTMPCLPYATDPWLFHALIILAALDCGIVQLNWRQAALLLTVHTVTVVIASRRSMLCAGAASPWDMTGLANLVPG